MNRMKSEHIAVRTRIRTTEVQFRRLHQAIEQAFTNFKQQPAPESESPPTSPPDICAAFRAAAIADRPALVKQWLEIVCVLQVHVTRTVDGDYKVKFDPKPSPGQLLFLTGAAQLIRLQQLDQTVQYDNLETNQPSQMKLKEFVKHVQTGAWLLKPTPLLV
jgi:hypothetical protein